MVSGWYINCMFQVFFVLRLKDAFHGQTACLHPRTRFVDSKLVMDGNQFAIAGLESNWIYVDAVSGRISNSHQIRRPYLIIVSTLLCADLNLTMGANGIPVIGKGI